MNGITITVEPGTPARVDAARAAKYLGVNAHDIPTLCRARLLKPLGSPAPSAPKYFATCELIRLANDVAWLDKATRAITQFCRNKNGHRADREYDVN